MKMKPILIFHRVNSQEILEEISSVALLSPACIIYTCRWSMVTWRMVTFILAGGEWSHVLAGETRTRKLRRKQGIFPVYMNNYYDISNWHLGIKIREISSSSPAIYYLERLCRPQARHEKRCEPANLVLTGNVDIFDQLIRLLMKNIYISSKIN